MKLNDAKIYTFGKDIESVFFNMDEDLANALCCFKCKVMADNAEKFQAIQNLLYCVYVMYCILVFNIFCISESYLGL